MSEGEKKKLALYKKQEQKQEQNKEILQGNSNLDNLSFQKIFVFKNKKITNIENLISFPYRDTFHLQFGPFLKMKDKIPVCNITSEYKLADLKKTKKSWIVIENDHFIDFTLRSDCYDMKITVEFTYLNFSFKHKLQCETQDKVIFKDESNQIQCLLIKEINKKDKGSIRKKRQKTPKESSYLPEPSFKKVKTSNEPESESFLELIKESKDLNFEEIINSLEMDILNEEIKLMNKNFE